MKRTPLRSDPAKTRAWQERVRRPLRRSRVPRLAQTGAGRETAPDVALAWRRAVWELCGGRCIATGQPVRRDAVNWHAHHAILAQKLPPALRHDPRVGVVLLREPHFAHHARQRVIPLEALPAYVVAFATELGDWALAALERQHPPG